MPLKRYRVVKVCLGFHTVISIAMGYRTQKLTEVLQTKNGTIVIRIRGVIGNLRAQVADCTLPGNYHVGSPQLPSTLVTMEKIRYATPKVEVRSLENRVASINFSVQFPEPVKMFLP